MAGIRGHIMDARNTAPRFDRRPAGPSAQTREVHALRVRTAAGDVWEVRCDPIRGTSRATGLALDLRALLAAPEHHGEGEPGPVWAREVRAAVAAAGAPLSACLVELVRGRKGEPKSDWAMVARLPVVPDHGRAWSDIYTDGLPHGGHFIFAPCDPAENALSPSAGVLILYRGRSVGTCRVEEFPADLGRGFQLLKMTGGTDPEEGGYAVFCVPHREPTCECKGFLRWAHCKHAESVGACVENGWL
jgi:hypothetical protein